MSLGNKFESTPGNAFAGTFPHHFWGGRFAEGFDYRWRNTHDFVWSASDFAYSFPSFSIIVVEVVSDGIVLSDVLSAGFPLVVVDGATLSDSDENYYVFNISDGLSLSDSAGVLWALVVVCGESAVLSDSPYPCMALPIHDATVLSDSAYPCMALLIHDAAVLSDYAHRNYNWRALNFSATIGEYSAKVIPIDRVFLPKSVVWVFRAVPDPDVK